MKQLGELLQDLNYTLLTVQGDAIQEHRAVRRVENLEITDITDDSLKAVQGGLFFCIEGAVRDGHEFALQVLEKGARVLVVEKMPDLSSLKDRVWEGKEPFLVLVKDSRRAMALMSAAWYGHPARELKTIGVTGTKGKTTTTYMVRSILEAAGIRTGLIGTIETLYETPEGEVRIPSGNTTPESIALHRELRRMVDSGVKALVMEVSSQALKLHRTAGFVFDLGIFTNLSPDHISPIEHKDFDDYLHCKSLLFRQCRVGILNGDDPWCGRILEGHTCRVETFGLGENNDLCAKEIELIQTRGELGIAFNTVGLLSLHAHIPAPGRVSVYNALCAMAVCRHFGVSEENIRNALRNVHVRGRTEMIKVSDDFILLIDYAHNAMALESLLTTLREYVPGRLVCVFGCGGNRARARRFEMGEVSGRLADLTIITSDNPRFEEPMDIIADIVTGIEPTGGNYVTVPDRKEAIRYAIGHGQPRDIIVLAGKGHEDYQEIRGKKYPMDERELIREVLEEMR